MQSIRGGLGRHQCGRQQRVRNLLNIAVDRHQGNAAQQFQPVGRRSRIPRRSFANDQLGSYQLEIRPLQPPPVTSLDLERSDIRIGARPRGRVAHDRRFDVNRGHETSLADSIGWRWVRLFSNCFWDRRLWLTPNAVEWWLGGNPQLFAVSVYGRF